MDELSGDVRDYHRIFNALVSISPVPVRFEEIESGAKGYYHDGEKRIAIQSGMSQAQTINVADTWRADKNDRRVCCFTEWSQILQG